MFGLVEPASEFDGLLVSGVGDSGGVGDDVEVDGVEHDFFVFVLLTSVL